MGKSSLKFCFHGGVMNKRDEIREKSMSKREEIREKRRKEALRQRIIIIAVIVVAALILIFALISHPNACACFFIMFES